MENFHDIKEKVMIKLKKFKNYILQRNISNKLEIVILYYKLKLTTNQYNFSKKLTLMIREIKKINLENKDFNGLTSTLEEHVVLPKHGGDEGPIKVPLNFALKREIYETMVNNNNIDSDYIKKKLIENFDYALDESIDFNDYAVKMKELYDTINIKDAKVKFNEITFPSDINNLSKEELITFYHTLLDLEQAFLI